MAIKVLIGCYLILIATAWFNYDIVLTQQVGDNQQWHISQLIQWIVVYGSIAYLTGKWLVVIGYALTYPFFYDGLLHTFQGTGWFYQGYEEYGANFTLDYRIKIVLLVLGLALIFYNKVKEHDDFINQNELL